MPLLAIFAAAAIFGLVVFVLQKGDSSTTSGTSPGAGVEALKRFSFQMSPAEVGTLFGVDGSGEVTVEMEGPGIIRQVRVSYGGRGGPSYQLMLVGGEQFGLDAIRTRIAKMAPNQLKKLPFTDEISVAKSLLRIDPRNGGSIQVATWEKDDARAKALADAFWAAARYGIFGSPEPSAEELALVNGPTLATAAGLDPTVAIESASKAFQAQLPAGACQTQTNLTTSRNRMVCSAEVNHPLVSKIEFAWRNGAKALADCAALTLARTSRDDNSAASTLSACLDTALGPGQDVVVDHATGQSHRTWTLAPAGDAAVLDGYALRLDAPAGHDPVQAAGWSGRFREIVTAVDGCGR